MRQTRTHAFSVPDVGVWLWPHELQALMGLPAWCMAMFVHLVVRTDFKSGAGRTGYGELINALTPDQPERGPRLWAPSRDDIKAGMRRLEALRIVAVDRLRSEQLQTINFLLAPRQRRGVPNGKLPPKLSPGSVEGKEPKLSPGTPPALSTEILNPLPLSASKLSTGEGRAAAQQVLAKMGAARGKARAPKGA